MHIGGTKEWVSAFQRQNGKRKAFKEWYIGAQHLEWWVRLQQVGKSRERHISKNEIRMAYKMELQRAWHARSIGCM